MKTLEGQLKQQEEANKVVYHDRSRLTPLQALQETLDQLKKKRKDLSDVNGQLSQLRLEREAVQLELVASKKQLENSKRVSKHILDFIVHLSHGWAGSNLCQKDKSEVKAVAVADNGKQVCFYVRAFYASAIY